MHMQGAGSVRVARVRSLLGSHAKSHSQSARGKHTPVGLRQQLFESGGSSRRQLLGSMTSYASEAKRVTSRASEASDIADASVADSPDTTMTTQGQEQFDAEQTEFEYFGHHTMPGFRVTSEDAVAMHPATSSSSTGVQRLGGGLSTFAVLDGHGGRDAADYCAANLQRVFEAHVALNDNR
jgi:hypothetical protein